MCIHININVCVCVCVEREKERERRLYKIKIDYKIYLFLLKNSNDLIHRSTGKQLKFGGQTECGISPSAAA